MSGLNMVMGALILQICWKRADEMLARLWKLLGPPEMADETLVIHLAQTADLGKGPWWRIITGNRNSFYSLGKIKLKRTMCLKYPLLTPIR